MSQIKIQNNCQIQWKIHHLREFFEWAPNELQMSSSSQIWALASAARRPHSLSSSFKAQRQPKLSSSAAQPQLMPFTINKLNHNLILIIKTNNKMKSWKFSFLALESLKSIQSIQYFLFYNSFYCCYCGLRFLWLKTVVLRRFVRKALRKKINWKVKR